MRVSPLLARQTGHRKEPGQVAPGDGFLGLFRRVTGRGTGRTGETAGRAGRAGGAVFRPPAQAGPVAGQDLPAPAASSPAPGVPPPGLIRLEPGKWYDPRTREIWTNDTGQWVNLGVASEISKTVQVAPGMEVPLGLHLAARMWGVRTLPGVGFFAGGQFIRGKPDQWRRRPTPEELAFGQMLVNHPELDPRLRPADPNPRTYFRDLNLYWELVRTRGVPQTPQEALDFWWEYQWREYEKKVAYAQAVGMDPSIYPPPDRWSEVLDSIGRPSGG